MQKNKKTIAAVLLIFAALGFSRFSSDVRGVDALGLFSSGVIAGMAIIGLVNDFKAHKAVQ